MAEVSYLQPHGNGDDNGNHNNDDEDYREEEDQVVVSFNQHNNNNNNNNCSCDLDGFDLYPSDLDCPSFDGFLCDRNPHHDDSVLLDRENQMNFVIDMFHQRVEQSQSQSQSELNSASRVINGGDLANRDRNEVTDANDLGRYLGLGLGFRDEVNDNRDNSDGNLGFMLADCGDDFFVSRRTLNSRSESESENPANRSIGPEPEYITAGFRPPDLGSDTDIAGENEIDFATDTGCEIESNLRLSWDAFQLGDNNDNDRSNQDFEWEEVDDRIDDREILNMIFESEADDDLSVLPEIPIDAHEFDEQNPDSSSLEWEVLLNVHSLEGSQLGGHYDEYNYAEYDMLFEQFADGDAASLGRPPAARTVVEGLLTVVMTELDHEKNNTLCAVCKDEIGVGLMGKQLPCGHRYHGDCIVPWLSIRNTCPVCRHELPTDDVEYERRRAERGGRDR